MGRIDNHDGRAWRARAEECRAIADTFENPETRAKMFPWPPITSEWRRMPNGASRPRHARGPGSVGIAVQPRRHFALIALGDRIRRMASVRQRRRILRNALKPPA